VRDGSISRPVDGMVLRFDAWRPQCNDVRPRTRTEIDHATRGSIGVPQRRRQGD
jgi:hypothetical protein